MQKRILRSLPLAALLVASAQAQSSTTTFTIPVCPTATSITITLPTTVTFCPGPHCNGGGSGPQMTPAPVNGVGMPGVNVGQYTSVGADGKTTVLGIWETVYNSMCETGLVPATYTITQECPCEATAHPTVMPVGFQTTVVPCSVCAHPTVTLTQPCPTGPYASQTPSVGQAPAMPVVPAAAMPAAGAMASAGASASAVAGTGMGPGGASAAAGAGSGASAQSGPGGASANAGSGSGASAQSGPGGSSANAGTGSGANAQAGVGGSSASAGSGASAQAGSVGAVPSPGMNGMAVSPELTNGTMGNTTTHSSPKMEPYMGSAGHVTIAGFTILGGLVAALLL